MYVTYELIVQFGRCSSSSYNLDQQLTMSVTGIFARVIIIISPWRSQLGTFSAKVCYKKKFFFPFKVYAQKFDVGILRKSF